MHFTELNKKNDDKAFILESDRETILISLLKAADLIAEKIATESADEELSMGEVSSHSGVICDLINLSLNSIKSKPQYSYCEQPAPTSPQRVVEKPHESASTTFAASSLSTPFGPFFYPTTSTIGDRIREMRKSAGVSQRKLAEQISVTGVCILKWETNQTQPGCDKLIPLANALNCDPMWLLTGEKADTQRAPE